MVNMWGRRAQIRNTKRLSHLFVLAMDTLSGLRPQEPPEISTNVLTVPVYLWRRNKCEPSAKDMPSESDLRTKCGPSADKPAKQPRSKARSKCEAAARQARTKCRPSADQVLTKRPPCPGCPAAGQVSFLGLSTWPGHRQDRGLDTGLISN